ncbi:MAG: hypothetical protein ACK47C_15850 [Paracoccaceae bacterium]
MVSLIANFLGNLLDPLAATFALLLPVFWESWLAVVVAVLVGFIWLAVILNGYGTGALLLPVAWLQVGVPLLVFALVGKLVLLPILRRRFA